MSKKVLVNVWNRDGSLRAVLTYEAPDDAEVGDSGRVLIHNRRTGDEPWDATIVSLTPDYTGPCRPFWPTKGAPA